LVPAIRDSNEVTGELHQQPLLRRHERFAAAYPLKEVADVDIERLSQFRTGALR
jgi:hypothetical protein